MAKKDIIKVLTMAEGRRVRGIPKAVSLQQQSSAGKNNSFNHPHKETIEDIDLPVKFTEPMLTAQYDNVAQMQGQV
jgi:hypothetical protein